MALSERPQLIEPSPASNTPNREGESVGPKRTSAIDILRQQRFMGIPKIIAAPILTIMTLATTGYGLHEVYENVPPVKRTVDKVWDASLETFGLRTSDNPTTEPIGGNTTEAK